MPYEKQVSINFFSGSAIFKAYDHKIELVIFLFYIILWNTTKICQKYA